MWTPEHATVGRYELRGRLGSGGMGTVWHAFDPILQRDVAVKEVLLPDGMSEEDRNEAHARTLREAQATARIHHSAIVTVHDVLEHDGSPWIVMELLSGSSLHHRIETHGPMPVERVEEAARALLGGLKAAHAVGVTHRDVKPANIMLTEDDRTVLMDFGIANVDGSAALTQTGVYIGSPEYMAPERFEGERALPASDLWSLGVTLYSLLEGRSPFKRGSVTGMISAVLTAPVPPHLSRNEAAGSPRGAALQALISALLTRETGARPSPSEALELLERERRNAQRDVRTRKTALPEETTVESAAMVGQVGPVAVSRTLRVEAGTEPHVGAAEELSRGPARGTAGRGVAARGASGPEVRKVGEPRPGTPAQGSPARNQPVPVWGGPTPVPRGPVPVPVPRQGGPQPLVHARARTRQQIDARSGHPSPVPRQAGATTEAARNFLEGTGYTPSGTLTSVEPEKPAGVLTAMGMLGLNAVVLFVFTIVTVVGSTNSAAPSWGTALFLGTWGLLSALGALAMPTRFRSVFALVVVGQACGVVSLGIRMFEVIVHDPDLVVLYVLALLYTSTVGGLLLLPAPSRAFFRLGRGKPTRVEDGHVGRRFLR
ncbi:serine/threonine-protein kinase [Nocardiopsis listeri]|uniref:serine/threonine-protein kinase n=1 Tax=Nocardiopsis listeri TaxID=53440 RepID=UPI0008323A7B|nr:serine/threonine-protein kinase [Nocardiopsis listeri]